MNTPVIAWVWTGMLTYADKETSHVVVVTGYDDNHVFLHDRAMTEAPQTVVWDSFWPPGQNMTRKR